MGLDSGSEIRDQEKNLFRIPDPGPGSKRHRIPDPDPQHCSKGLLIFFLLISEGIIPYCCRLLICNIVPYRTGNVPL
jgi:hypothetical protein